MKKSLIALIGSILLIFFCGCAPKTEESKFATMEISKIESSWREGFAPFPRDFSRTFDFTTGKIIDTLVTDQSNLSDLSKEEKNKYNTPTTIATFSDEQAKEFIQTVKALGFYDWEERYVTTDQICDGGSHMVTVYFSDGTVKSTYIYFEDPPEYKAIAAVFQELLGAKLYLDTY